MQCGCGASKIGKGVVKMELDTLEQRSDRLMGKITALEIAVEALIATHANPRNALEAFDLFLLATEGGQLTTSLSDFAIHEMQSRSESLRQGFLLAIKAETQNSGD